jgi:hypothetical protein
MGAVQNCANTESAENTKSTDDNDESITSLFPRPHFRAWASGPQRRCPGDLAHRGGAHSQNTPTPKRGYLESHQKTVGG